MDEDVRTSVHSPKNDYRSATDAEIVFALAAKHQAALAELFARYGSLVLGVAKRVVGDLSLAEDVTQEVFLGIWQNPGRFDQRRGSLRTLLVVQCHGKSVDLVRSRNATKIRERKTADTPPRAPLEIDYDLMQELSNAGIRDALRQLSPADREVIDLAFFGSQTYRQVAVTLGLPEGTVKARIRSALKRLHSILSLGDALV